MAPMVQRIADGLFQRLRPFLKLFPVAGIPSNVALIHAVGAHLAPLIMVPSQPNLRNIVKLPVLINFLRTDMAVIINNRHICRHIMIQMLCCLRCQKKIFTHKTLHK